MIPEAKLLVLAFVTFELRVSHIYMCGVKCRILWNDDLISNLCYLDRMTAMRRKWKTKMKIDASSEVSADH